MVAFVVPLVKKPTFAKRNVTITRVKAQLAPAHVRQNSQSPLRSAQWVVTIVGELALAPGPRDAVKNLVESHSGNVEKWRELAPSAVEASVFLPSPVAADDIRSALQKAASAHRIDLILQEQKVFRERKALAVFDLDSTLIAQETIDELAAEVGVMAEVSAITERAMNGEILFRDALRERVALLEGLPVGALEAVKDRTTYTPGAYQLVRALSALGCETAVVSGGFDFLTSHVQRHLGLTHSFANKLEVDQKGLLTGRTVGSIVDAEFKAAALQSLAEAKNIPKEKILAVGDGSNDVLMLEKAGLGVAFNAKPMVQNRSKACVNQPSLHNVLYLLGLDDDQIEELVR